MHSRSAANSELTLTWQATARARSGLIVDKSLFYVTGGAAFQRAKWIDAITATTTSPSQTVANFSFADKILTGWVAGGGIEQMLAPNFTWRIEYLYENFQDFTVPHGIGAQLGAFDNLTVHKVRAGFSYKP